MTLGSAIFFAIKVAWIFTTEATAIMPAWLSYLLVHLFLTVFGWLYHGKISFEAQYSRQNFIRYVFASTGFKLLDYFGFVTLSYMFNTPPILAVILVAGCLFVLRFITSLTYVFATPAGR